MADSCKMMIDEETGVDSFDNWYCEYAAELENSLQWSDEEAKSWMTGPRKQGAANGNGIGTKKRRQTNDVGEPSEAFHQPDYAMELENQHQACDIVQGQAKTKMKKLTPVRRRKQQSPNVLPKAKEKGHQTFDVSLPAEASQPPKPMGKEIPVRELFIKKKKTAPKVCKILRDRINRRRNIDEREDMKACIQLWTMVSKYKIEHLNLAIQKSCEKISKEWPPRADLVNVLQQIQAMNNNSTVDDKLILRFEAIEQEIKNLDQNRAKDSEKVLELATILCDEGLRTDALREKLSTIAPWLDFEENATNESPKDNTPEGITANELSNTLPCGVLGENPTCEIPGDGGDGSLTISVFDYAWNEVAVTLRKNKEDLYNELFDKRNIQVEVSDFHGLQDAINGARDGIIPDHLKPFAMIIEQDHGELAPANSQYQTLLVLLSAAHKEMQELPDHELNRPILRKWAATSNLADRMGFQPPVFKKLLDKMIHDYLYRSLMNSGSEN